MPFRKRSSEKHFVFQTTFLIGNYHSYFIGCDGNDENGFFFPSLYY
ncbi:hypothetical protein HMPREF3156_00079 [Neisseria sp. HMSC06F02]|nr:hypothetical protein HMPREF3156_00079 [Neisseria sp. HMSC06F02]